MFPTDIVPAARRASPPTSHARSALAAVLLLGSASAASPQSPAARPQPRPSLDARIDAAIARLTPEIIAIRHRIHQHPELGNQETETAALAAVFLRRLGFEEVRTGVAGTGVTGILRGGRPGPYIAVRADMDALPVTEATDLPFASTRRGTWNGREVGIAHACGHDIHVAVQLGVAAILAELRAELPGTVQFIFQPAEEGVQAHEPPGGAERMLAEGIWRGRKPEAVFALHAAGEDPVGTVGWTVGPRSAASDRFAVRIIGRQGHAASPDQAVDPVVVASQVVLGWQAIISRNLPPLEGAVITTGMIHGGDRENIIPAEVELRGSVRTQTEAARGMIERRLREVAEGIAASAGATVAYSFRRGYPPTVNDSALAHRLRPALARAVGEGGVRVQGPALTGEDFAFLARETPGFYFGLGTLAPGTTSGPHHSPTFRADDSAIPVGMRAMSFVLVDYLQGGGR